MLSSTICSYAILKANWEENKYYIDSFIPIIAECIRLSRHDIVSIQDLKTEVKNRFGLDIPLNSINYILKRVKKIGYIKYDKTRTAFVRDLKKLDELNFSAYQNEFYKAHTRVIESIKEYTLRKHDEEWTNELIEKALLAYIEKNQITLLEDAIYKKINKSGSIPNDSYSNYIIGSFFRFAFDNNLEEFQYLETIIKGNMLANTIYLPDPGKIHMKFKNTSVYLDTSFLMFALGYSGDAREEPCKELLDLLRLNGAKLKCFSHNVDEIRGNLRTCIPRLDWSSKDEMYGLIAETIENFRRKGIGPIDIEDMINRLPTKLDDLHVEIVEKPDYLSKSKYLINESELTSMIQTNMPRQTDQALKTDVDSISAILRLREGHKAMYVEESKAIFVTTNHTLANTSREFYIKNIDNDSIPPAITDTVLTNLLWVKTPLKAPDLPRKRILAYCYAATKPEEHLWQKYIAEIHKLMDDGQITLKDYLNFRYNQMAKDALMNLTKGDENAFTQGTVDEIIRVMNEEARKAFEDELEKTKAEKEKLEVAVTKKDKRIEEIKNTIFDISEKFANAIVVVIGAVIILPIVINTFTSLPLPGATLLDYIKKFIPLGIILIIPAALGLINSIWGLSIVSIINFIRKHIKSAIARLLLKILKLE